MGRATTNALLVLGFLLLVLGVVALMRQVGEAKPIEWAMPCVLLLGGGSLLGGALFFAAGAADQQCSIPDPPSSLDHDLDPDA